jgi:serine/threonine protein kinase
MIVETEPEYNKNWSKNLRDLLGKLLLKSPEERMKHILTIKEHPWFAMLHWQELIARTAKPPFVPLLDGECDVSNFAAQFTKCSVNSHGDSLEECNAYEGFSFKRSNSSPSIKPLQLQLEHDTE